MLSILLYGRNDSHGYNLHKRAAISLNAMAELLVGDGDEIVFVDYNTPDDLPTFPEAIHDTLSARAIERLRILRVRPRDHAQFASRTHLVALEPIARNVALRRSNPSNRWVLSTNTDMIFAPKERDQTLTGIVANLPDGFYHLPRFELPEALWEALDRKDGRGIIRQVSDWGSRFHLREIVHSGYANLYDAPGDFQLALRSDLFAIHGFHEEMLIGWHVDANLAQRMLTLRGKVSSLAHRLEGYHCDHTRQATAVHKRDRVENDVSRFVANAVQPEIPSQADTWGLLHGVVEEIDISVTTSAKYLVALESVLPEPAPSSYEASYTSDTYNTFHYPAEHVAPYVLDLITCAPEGIRIGYAGARADMFSMISKALHSLNPSAILEPAPHCKLLPGQRVSADDAAWIDAHELYIFEVGQTPGACDDQSAAELRSVAVVFDLFRRFIESEDVRQVDNDMAPRRVIAINAIHTYFEVLVTNWIAHTTTPFSSRVRHGFAIAERLGERGAQPSPDFVRVGEALSRTMGRTYPAPASEARRLIEMAQLLPITMEADVPGWTAALHVAEPLIALLRDWKMIGTIARDPAELEVIVHLLEANRASACMPVPLCRFPVRTAAGEAATRLADIDDWERPSWVAYAQRYMRGKGAYDYFLRSPSIWEQVTILDELGREFGWGASKQSVRPCVLVVSHDADHIVSALTDAGASVDILDPLHFLDQASSALDWRGNLGAGLIKLTEPVGLFVEKVDQKSAVPYDAVVLPRSSAFIGGRAKAGELIAQLRPWVKEGGVFVLTAEVRFSGQFDGASLAGRLVRDGLLSKEMHACAGLYPLRGFDGGFSRRTADSCARPGAQPPDIESFIGDREGWVTGGIWFWRAMGPPMVDVARLTALLETTNEDNSLEEGAEPDSASTVPLQAKFGAEVSFQPLTARALGADNRAPVANGSQMTRVASAGPGRLSPRGVKVGKADPPGPFALAPLGVAVAGVYELIVEARVAAGGRGNALAIEVFSGDASVTSAVYSVVELSMKARRSIEFEIPVRKGVSVIQPIEVRLCHYGACDMEIVNLSLYTGARV